MSFIINRWVRGKDFFGRTQLLEHIKSRLFKPTWVLGNRRVGKSSLLRQIQYLCQQEVWEGWTALYWDLQGAGSGEGLKNSFLECLEDQEELVDLLGLDLDELEECNLKDLLNKFRRKAKNLKEKKLLLLIDECEELVDVTAKEPGILAPFRKLTQGDFPLGIVMAGSWRMMDLDESDSITSPFLPDFLPPLLLGPFEQEESLQLLNLRGIEEQQARQIHGLCLGNPHLLQVLGEHTQRTQSLETALTELSINKVAFYFFQSNFNCLPPTPRPWFAAKTACEQLANLTTQESYFPQIKQSALVREEHGTLKVSPLLYLVERNMEPAAVIELIDGAQPSHSPIAPKPALETPTPPAAKTKQAEPPTGQLQPILNATHLLITAKRIPSLLHPSSLASGLLPQTEPFADLQALAEAKLDPAGLHHILNQASPEFVRSEPADQRTAVYFIGLYWYWSLAHTAPFAEIPDPWDRVEALSSQDVPLPEGFRLQYGLSGKHAMILMRCLRSQASQRYQSLELLAQDLGQ